MAKKLNPWMAHVQAVRKQNPGMKFMDVLKKAKTSYKMGSTADRYGKAVENMPPLPNGRIAQESGVLAYISDRIAEVDGDCTLKEAQRVFYCFANMKAGPIIFDKATRLWRGRNYAI